MESRKERCQRICVWPEKCLKGSQNGGKSFKEHSYYFSSITVSLHLALKFISFAVGITFKVFITFSCDTRSNYRSFAHCSGLDGRGLVWDLRTGQCVMSLDGHLKKVLGIDFARDG